MATTTIEIAGSPVGMSAANLWPASMSLALRGISTLTLVRHGVTLSAPPDPWLWKPIVLKVDGVPVFAGDVTDRQISPSELGWTAVYQCRDLRARGDRVPFLDSNTLGDEARWNYDAEDEDKIDARLGRTVGQILEDALTMQTNADALDAKGIGGYVSLSPPTLPADTLADLAAMTIIPPMPVSMGGERLLGAIDSFLGAWAPNHAMWVRPDGVIRFIDLRAVSELTLTLGDCDDRLEPSPLSRSLSDCYTRVVVLGRAVAEGKLLSLSAGTLEEYFAWGAYDNAGAKAAWTESDFAEDAAARSQGSVSVTDLTHVVLTSDPATQAWGSNEWDQSNRQGRIYLTDTTGSGINYVTSSRVVANTAKSSGGTSTFTLETALPGTDFDSYVLYGLSSGASLVYRRYRVVDPDIRDALARRMTYPVPYVLAGGGAGTMTSYPIGSVCWSTTGSPPYNEFPVPITVYPGDGTFIFATPTYKLAGGPPADVRILAAVYTQTLTATRPASGHEGTAYAIDGMEETLTIPLDSWRDPANAVNVQSYAQDQLDAVKDAVVEGSLTIQKLYTPALGFGVGISIEGSDYETGWEGANLPVVQVDVTWNSRGASHHTTTLRVSNRRANYSAAAFLQPERRSGDGTMGLVDFGMTMGGMSPYGGMGDSGFGQADFGQSMDQAASDYSVPPPQDDFAAMMDMMGPAPTSAKDPRSRFDPTPARDSTSPRDPRSPHDDTPAGERPYKPGRKYTTARPFTRARKFDAPDRKAESQQRRQAASDRQAKVDQRQKANAAEGKAMQEKRDVATARDQGKAWDRWQNQADPDAARREQSVAGKRAAADMTEARQEKGSSDVAAADQARWEKGMQGERERADIAERNRRKQQDDEARSWDRWINQGDPNR